MSFGSRLRERREALGMKQSELGQLLGVTGSAIGNYENEVSSPKADILYRVFDVLHCDANYLFQDEIKERRNCTATPDEMEKIIKKYRHIDKFGQETVLAVLDCEYNRCAVQKNDCANHVTTDLDKIIYIPEPLQSASAGTGEFSDDDNAEQVAVLYNKYTSKADYIMRVHGNSMEPQIFDGDRVLVRSQPAVDLGETGIFILNGDRYVKIYRGSYLESANPTYANVPVCEDGRCIGKVISVLNPEWVVEK